MKKLSLLLLAFVLPALSWAQIIPFTATMTGSQENPPNASTATGFAFATLDLGTNLFTFHDTWSGLSAPATASHIHSPGAPGTNGPVLFPFGAAQGFVAGTTSGTIDFSAVLTSTQVTQLLSGLMYVNVHSGPFPGGEIRGQITAAIPEPSTYALAGVAALGAIVLVRRVRTKRICAEA